ncbi:hypothetical protein N7535_007031 [Penicillium sp. DV-2018c]|nr:hypothetical protein N7461_006875 [Penicillium sp. DV-2018c]KAJ5567725.1 hypothetical protein N7535_007031 [Penicillium sp. DV-2018c]
MKQMLWNWHTLDACFLFPSWHITSRAMFAGSCIAVVFLVVLLEFLRRLGREFDAFLIRRARLRAKHMATPSLACCCDLPSSPPLLRDIGPGEGRLDATHDGNAWTSHHESIDANAPGRNQTKDVNATSAAQAGHEDGCDGGKGASELPIQYLPSLLEHLVRSILHTFEFAVACIIILLAMYLNGYIVICIFVGVFLGAFLFSWEPLNFNRNQEPKDAFYQLPSAAAGRSDLGVLGSAPAIEH